MFVYSRFIRPYFETKLILIEWEKINENEANDRRRDIDDWLEHISILFWQRKIHQVNTRRNDSLFWQTIELDLDFEVQTWKKRNCQYSWVTKALQCEALNLRLFFMKDSKANRFFSMFCYVDNSRLIVRPDSAYC